MKRNRRNTRRKTPAEEEAGVSTRAAKKRNTTIVTGKGTEKAKKKSATKEHGKDEYSPENVVIAATENNNPSPLLNTMKLDEGDNYADNNNKDGPIISSILPASVLPDALETAVNTASSTQQVGGRIYSSTNEAWADACAAAAVDIATQVQGSGVIKSNDDEMLDKYENDDDNKEDDDYDDDDTRNTTAATHNNVNTDISSGIALGSDLIYLEHYGLLDEDDDEEEEEEVEEEEEASAMCSKPTPPNTSQMSPTEAKAAMKQYRRDYKKIYDKQRLQSIKSASASNHSSSPQKSQNFTGDQTPSIRQMVVVETNRLMVGHSFQCKETLQLRAAEEANLRMIKVTTVTSDSLNYTLIGKDFCVSATCGKRHGWVVNVAVCRDGDDTSNIPSKCRVFDEKSLRNPFRGEWVGHLIQSAVEQTPGIPYQMCREITAFYANKYCITDNVLQSARNFAKKDLFGTAEDNVQYAYVVQKALRDIGHYCDLTFSGRQDLIRNVRSVVLKEEQSRRERCNEPTLKKGGERDKYVNAWFDKHKDELVAALGTESEDGPQTQFLTGIMVATSTSKAQVQHCQDVIQADGAHTAVGKYTLFAAYTTSSNATMVCLGIAFLYGNEDKANWKKFWTFIKEIHPSVNMSNKTIITDQDKGSLASIIEILPLAQPFLCAFHRRQNITKKFGGGKGRGICLPHVVWSITY